MKPEDVAKLPFSNIKIIDARFDTSKIGFMLQSRNVIYSKSDYERVTLKQGVAKELELYYNKTATDPNSGYGLLILIKKLWISEAIPYRIQKNSQSGWIGDSARIAVKWELYISNKEEYLPFKRIDTTIHSWLTFNSPENKKTIQYKMTSVYNILNYLLSQYDYTKAISVFPARQKKSLSQIMALDSARFNIAILKDNSIKKGVYFNFNEFKNNTPGTTDFIEKAVKYGGSRKDEFITDIKDSSINNYWAYSTDDYTRVGPYGNETIFRIGNTFEFFVKRRIAMPRRPGNVVFKNHYDEWIPYQVDMETGEFN